MENKETFKIKDYKFKKDYSFWFFIVCGIFLAWQVSLTTIKTTNIFNLNINISYDIWGFIGLLAFLLGLILSIFLNKHTTIIIKIILILNSILNLLILIPISSNFSLIIYYGIVALSNILIVPYLYSLITNLSVTSAFVYSFISLISSGITYFLLTIEFVKSNFIFYSIVAIFTSILLFIYYTKNFENIKIVKYERTIKRIFSKEEKINNPLTTKKQKRIFPFKLILTIFLLILISSIIISLVTNTIQYKLNDLRLYFLGASFGSALMALIFKISKKKIQPILYSSILLMLISIGFLFSDNLILFKIGTICFAITSPIINLNLFYNVIAFEETPSKLLTFLLITMQLIPQSLSIKIQESSTYVILIVSIILVILLAIVFIVNSKYLMTIWNKSHNGYLYKFVQKSNNLTQLESLIYELLLSGYSKNQISEILYIRKDSVNHYIAKILNKLGANEIAKKYFKNYLE